MGNAHLALWGALALLVLLITLVLIAVAAGVTIPEPVALLMTALGGALVTVVTVSVAQRPKP